MGVLEYHLLQLGDGRVGYSSLLQGEFADEAAPTLLNAEDVQVTSLNGKLYINSAQITVSDILVENGVVHVLDKYISPFLSLSHSPPFLRGELETKRQADTKGQCTQSGQRRSETRSE